jgi:diguanylate cyclase (GGDEF)-like protein
MKPRASPLYSRLSHLLHRLLPPALLREPKVATRAENLLIGLMLGIVVLVFYGLFYDLLGDGINVLFCALGVGGLLATFGLLQLTASIVLASEMLVAIAFCVILALTSRLGGIGAPTVVWLAVCPLLATAAGGMRPGMIWAALSLLAVAAVYAADAAALFGPPQVSDMRLLHAVSTVSFVMTVAVFLLIYERINAGAILKLDQALALIRELAIRDELTGVFNRRELIRAVQQEQQRAERHGAPFCLCLIDLDHFKRINDRYGHAAGDHVLKRIAARIQEDIRKIDCFGRYGGEEFLLMLVGTDAEAAQGLLDRIRRNIETLDFPDELDGQPVTISAGIAQYRDREAIEDTLARADRALYRAKREGRNRVAVATGEPAWPVPHPADAAS